jgi:hypothetical protein
MTSEKASQIKNKYDWFSDKFQSDLKFASLVKSIADNLQQHGPKCIDDSQLIERLSPSTQFSFDIKDWFSNLAITKRGNTIVSLTTLSKPSTNIAVETNVNQWFTYYDHRPSRLRSQSLLTSLFIHSQWERISLVEENKDQKQWKEPFRQHSTHHMAHDAIWISDTVDGSHSLYIEELPLSFVDENQVLWNQYRPSIGYAYSPSLNVWKDFSNPENMSLITKSYQWDAKSPSTLAHPFLHKSRYLVGSQRCTQPDQWVTTSFYKQVCYEWTIVEFQKFIEFLQSSPSSSIRS